MTLCVMMMTSAANEILVPSRSFEIILQSINDGNCTKVEHAYMGTLKPLNINRTGGVSQPMMYGKANS